MPILTVLVYLAIVWAIVTGVLLLVLLAVTVAERVGLLHGSPAPSLPVPESQGAPLDESRGRGSASAEAAEELPTVIKAVQ